MCAKQVGTTVLLFEASYSPLPYILKIAKDHFPLTVYSNDFRLILTKLTNLNVHYLKNKF